MSFVVFLIVPNPTKIKVVNIYESEFKGFGQIFAVY